MIAHVVLYQLRQDLTPAEREQFAAALRRAIAEIPAIRRVSLGQRRSIGASYEAAMPVEYDYIGIFELDDEAGLKRYLEHPAHAELGRLFWQCSARTLVFDYQLVQDIADLRPSSPSNAS